MPPAINDVTVLFNAFGSGIGLFWSYLLLSRKDSGSSHYFLSSLLFLFVFFMINTIFQLSGYGKIIPFYQDLANALGFLVGPCIFGYILSHTRSDTKWLAHFWVHAIPFFVTTILLFVTPLVFFVGDVNLKLIYGWNIQTFIYLLLCFRELTKYKIVTHLPILMFRYFFLIWMLNLILFTIKTYGFPIPDIIFLNITLLFCLIIIMVAKRTFHLANTSETKQSQSFTLSKRHYHTYSLQLISFMETEKLYRNPDLTLQKLASITNISSRYISATLNQYHQKSFYDFINSYRIKEVIESFQNPEAEVYTINGLATQAGFKSTSAFYKAFRLQTGMTPGAFKKQLSDSLKKDDS